MNHIQSLSPTSARKATTKLEQKSYSFNLGKDQTLTLTVAMKSGKPCISQATLITSKNTPPY